MPLANVEAAMRLVPLALAILLGCSSLSFAQPKRTLPRSSKPGTSKPGTSSKPATPPKNVTSSQPSDAPRDTTTLEESLVQLAASVPNEAAKFLPEMRPAFEAAWERVERLTAQTADFSRVRGTPQLLAEVDRLLKAEAQVAAILDQTLELRRKFAAHANDPKLRESVCEFLRTNSALIDLSGRVRYTLVDALDDAGYRVSRSPLDRERLLDKLLDHKSDIGATTFAPLLVGPVGAEARNFQPLNEAGKSKLLRLIALARNASLVPFLVDFLNEGRPSPMLVVQTVDTIRDIGLPQDARPDQPAETPQPFITAVDLHKRLSEVSEAQLDPKIAQRRRELLEWLDGRARYGLTEPSLRCGEFDLQPGDWLLMRNPSPYNLFTDLSPGLFTHVGVVTLEKGDDGVQRLVLVDLPERGTKIPAANVEAFIQRSLLYVFLRHPDPAVAKAIADAARSTIGNESQFDLNFRTDRIVALKGQPLAGKKIHTYCAGMLLLTALQTGHAREEFFPLAESVAGGLTAENLQKIGMSIGKEFISPTGSLFSPTMQIAGRRRPLYDPRREVEEAVFDHFARGLESKPIQPSSDVFASLRLKLAEYSKTNPWLAKAIADVANVNRGTDLVAAAKAAAVVEMLDDAAYTASGDYLLARRAILEAVGEPDDRPLTPEQTKKMSLMPKRHARLVREMKADRLSPRQLRLELVQYYIKRGKADIDQRFFGTGPATNPSAAKPSPLPMN